MELFNDSWSLFLVEWNGQIRVEMSSYICEIFFFVIADSLIQIPTGLNGRIQLKDNKNSLKIFRFVLKTQYSLCILKCNVETEHIYTPKIIHIITVWVCMFIAYHQ